MVLQSIDHSKRKPVRTLTRSRTTTNKLGQFFPGIWLTWLSRTKTIGTKVAGSDAHFAFAYPWRSELHFDTRTRTHAKKDSYGFIN